MKRCGCLRWLCADNGGVGLPTRGVCSGRRTRASGCQSFTFRKTFLRDGRAACPFFCPNPGPWVHAADLVRQASLQAALRAHTLRSGEWRRRARLREGVVCSVSALVCPCLAVALSGWVFVTQAPEFIAVVARLHGPEAADQCEHVVGRQFTIVLPFQSGGLHVAAGGTQGPGSVPLFRPYG